MGESVPQDFIYDINAYDYELPAERIAQAPAEPRDASRLLVWNVTSGLVEHKIFSDISEYIKAGDLLVLNDTRVLPARLNGEKASGGKAEIMLLSPCDANFERWKALVRPGRRLGVGSKVYVSGRAIEIEEKEDDGVCLVRIYSGDEGCLEFLNKYGRTPLPPYIKPDGTTEAETRQRYQTVYANVDGSVAAPTAGLHFTKELLKRVEAKGAEIAWVTLRVGLGTFRPVSASDIREHNIHSEHCEVPQATEDAIARCRQRGRRVIAVGTTVVRTLESCALRDGNVRAGIMDTRLFIYPGFCYKVVEAMITNFHLPKSSLLMLASAFVNHLSHGEPESAVSALRGIYGLAISSGYRFFSYGDAMFIQK
ncbi:S-adenosylmethionine:tRNA ribosyltransferase-isomerase [Synergistales bacterium]|nr:S-adenosylmethionine:tRNA ribosyltransferase-isomerase [Synergistales bacterium]